MKITVIRAGMFDGKSRDAMKPLIFGILASLTPKTIAIEFIDDRIENLPNDIDSDIIAVSVDTFSARRAYILAKRYKNEDNIIVMGGFHPTACPQEVGEYADTVLMGDAENTWPFFLADYIDDKVKKFYDGTDKAATPLAAVADEEYPYKGKKYLKLGILQFSRGCRFFCDFCSIKTMYPGKVRQKTMAQLNDEIRNMKEKLIFFADDNLLADVEQARELCRALKPLRKKWACQISIDVAANDTLLTEMKESGCILLLIGFESLKKENLEQMNKHANIKAGSYKEAIDNIYGHGLMIYGTFVLGYDSDTKSDVQATMEFAMKNHLAIANFNPLIPMPGTKLYTRLCAQKRMLYDDKWWLADNYHYGDTAYEPAGMTADELRDACKEVRYKFYGFLGIWKRLWGLKLHHKPYQMVIYLLLNIVSAIEIHRKQGRLLGGCTDESDIDKA